jgi:ATP-dependent protease ClpP protease subunit
MNHNDHDDATYEWLDAIHDQDVDYRNKEIYLGGISQYIDSDQEQQEPGVEWAMTNRFIKNLRVLELQNPGSILIHMNTCGGDWHQGMAIYDAIKGCQRHVTVVNYSQARSMSSLIFLAADTRVMLKHSQFMFHLGSSGGDTEGEAIVNEHKEYVRSRKQMMQIYVNNARGSNKFAGSTDAQILATLKRRMQQRVEVYLSAEEAIEWGFADLIRG